MFEGLMWVVYVELRVCGTDSVMWNEGTELMTEFAMDAECWGSTSAFVDTIVDLNAKRCEGESRIVLTNVLTEPIGLWCRSHEKVGELLWWQRHAWQLDVPTATAHCEEWVSVAASTTR